MCVDKIYFDMDGVLADFKGYLLARGMPYARQCACTREQDAAMWEAIRATPHFYDLLGPIPGSLQLFSKLRERHCCEILSAVPKPKWGIPWAADDKRSWVRRLIGEDVAVNICHREEKKAFCAGPGCILIDDLPRNIEEWQDAGGTGILFTTAADVERLLL